MKSNCKLSVNINKIATLRNSRGGDTPNLLNCASDIIKFGADGITVHPRPDQRHIRRSDVKALSQLLAKINRRKGRKKIEFNIEGYPSPEFIRMTCKIKPDQVTLVPDPPHALTSNAGWRIDRNQKLLKKVISIFRKNKIRTSLFIDVLNWDATQMMALKEVHPDRVELYTEQYARDYVTKKRNKTTLGMAGVARAISEAGIAINAGHDLNSQNLSYLLKKIPEIEECSIGHALIAEALYLGFKKTLQLYRRKIRVGR